MPASRTPSSRRRSSSAARSHADQVGRRPDGAPGEHGHAVDVQIQAVAANVLRPAQRAKADAPLRPDRRRRRPRSTCAAPAPVRVGPPARRRRGPARRRRSARRACGTIGARRRPPPPRIDRRARPPAGCRLTLDHPVAVGMERSEDRAARADRAGARWTSSTGRQGPTAAGPGAKPGERPNIIVRNQRRLPGSTTRVRHRAAGRRRPASRGLSARQTITSSFSAARRSSTSSSWVRHIDADSSTSSPLRKTSLTRGDAAEAEHAPAVARTRRRAKATRNHQSSASKSRPARRRPRPPPYREPARAATPLSRVASAGPPSAGLAGGQLPAGVERQGRDGARRPRSRRQRVAERGHALIPGRDHHLERRARGQTARRRARRKEIVFEPSTTPLKGGGAGGRRRPEHPRDVVGEQLEGRARPSARSRTRTRGSPARCPPAGGEDRRPGCSAQAANGLRRGTAGEMVAEQLARARRAAPRRSAAGRRRSVTQLGERVHHVVGEVGEHPEGARGSPRRTARSSRRCGSSASTRRRDRSPPGRPSS